MLKTTILKARPKSIEKILQALTEQHVVGIPTETVYGLAGNAFSLKALSQIFSIKERPTFDPLIIHVSLEHGLRELSKMQWIDLSSFSQKKIQQMEKLTQHFWPGPLTLLLPKTKLIPDLATSGLPSVAIRMPSHPLAQSLLGQLSFPLAAPSANRFGRISPTTAKAVKEELGGRISYILDGGPCEKGLESTILATPSTQLNSQYTLLRPGAIPQEALEKILGEKIESGLKSQIESPTPLAPGMLKSHYAPRKPFHLLPHSFSELAPQLLEQSALICKTKKPIGLLLFSEDKNQKKKIAEVTQLFKKIGKSLVIEVLSSEGDLSKAAQSFFQSLRKLDHSEAEILFSEPCPNLRGLGLAIADRLRRASQSFLC